MSHATHATRIASDSPELWAVEQWALGFLGDVEHERRVRCIATALFDLTRPLHGMGPSARAVLEAAAFVHDIGRAVCDDDHDSAGALMILSDPTLPVSPEHRRALAFLTCYHRGGVPPMGRERILRDDDRASLHAILALLRAADALDCRGDQLPHLVFSLAGRTLAIVRYAAGHHASARHHRPKPRKFRLLEQTLDCRVEYDVRVVESFSLVA